MSSPLTSTIPSAVPAVAGLPSTLCGSERWYAVHSQPCSEMRASLQLQNQGFRTFMPQRRKTVRHARQTKTVTAPLFPRYFFVALDLTRDQWRSVNGTFGVSRLVMGGELPHPAPRGVVEALVASTDGDGFLNLAENLKPGSAVRLMTGPFADQLAILEHLGDAGRVQVLLDILGRRVRINTRTANLLPIA
jgi:transcriptional antiterminator RfaH